MAMALMPRAQGQELFVASFDDGTVGAYDAFVVTVLQQANDTRRARLAEEFKVLLQDIDRGETDVFRASWLGDYNDAYGFVDSVQF